MISTLKKVIYKLWSLRTNRSFRKKLNLIYRYHSFKDNVKPVDFFNFWKKFNIKADKRYYFLFSNVSGIDSMKYMPENIYYTVVEPVMNNMAMVKAYSNKNLYDHIYSNNNLFPTTILKRIDGVFYSPSNEIVIEEEIFKTLSTYESFIIKIAFDSGGGREVDLYKRNENGFVSHSGVLLSLDKLKSDYSSDIVIQEYIFSHPFFAQFNPSSLNTVRVFTYRSVIDEDIKILHTILRIGREGEIVDNQASGGISCGISNGLLNTFAIDKYGKKYFSSGKYFFEKKDEVPFYLEIIKYSKEIARQNHYARVLGLDFCVDKDGSVRLLEVNNKSNEINFYQMNNGPLFGDYTEEVIEWSQNHSKSICFDFNVL